MTTYSTEYNKCMEEMYDNIEEFDQKHLPEFNKIIKENKHCKLGIIGLIQKMEYFHKFTPDALEHMINTINKSPQTFKRYGPYVNTDNYWKIFTTSQISNEDKTKISEYKTKISAYKTKIQDQKKYISELEGVIKKMEHLKIE